MTNCDKLISNKLNFIFIPLYFKIMSLFYSICNLAYL